MEDPVRSGARPPPHSSLARRHPTPLALEHARRALGRPPQRRTRWLRRTSYPCWSPEVAPSRRDRRSVSAAQAGANRHRSVFRLIGRLRLEPAIVHDARRRDVEAPVRPLRHRIRPAQPLVLHDRRELCRRPAQLHRIVLERGDEELPLAGSSRARPPGPCRRPCSPRPRGPAATGSRRAAPPSGPQYSVRPEIACQ